MSAPNTKQLLDRMLASGKLSEDTAQELRDFQDDLAKDMLDPADAAYAEALARRLGFLGGGPAPVAAATDPEDEDEDEAESAPPAPAVIRPEAVLAAVRAAVDELCHPDRLAAEDPDRDAKARLHADLTARLDGIARDFA